MSSLWTYTLAARSGAKQADLDPCVATRGPAGTSLCHEDSSRLLGNQVHGDMVTTNVSTPASPPRAPGQRLNLEHNTDTSPQTLYNTKDNSVRDEDPVVSAIRRGDVKAVNELATTAPHSVMKESKDGWIPLHEAAYCGQAECLKALLKAQPGLVDKRTLQEQTALLLAVSCLHLSCVQCLLQAGADPDIGCKNKETPLYKACERQSVTMVSLILGFGATVNQRCNRGWTAFHEAVCRDDTEICEILVRAGATINPANTYSVTPLIVAAQRGRVEVLRFLIGRGSDVNMQMCDGCTALYEASKHGYREIVELLLSHNADANKPAKSGLLPLHIAAQHGHHEIVSLLVPVTSRARVRHSGISPLHLAAEHDRHAVAAVLLRTGSDVNSTLSHHRSLQYADRRLTALYFAVANGNAKTADLLLKAGASLTLDPLSPLLVAVRRGCVKTVSLLLEHGAEVNAGIPAYPTAFPSAVVLSLGNLPLLKCLLDNGCDALACFTCTHGSGPHPAPGSSHHTAHIWGANSNSVDVGCGSTDVADWLLNSDVSPSTCTEPAASRVQFCELLSSPPVCTGAGPILDLLLDYVGNVQMCSRLTELLETREEWTAIRRRSLSPCPLMHLCRLRVREQAGVHRVRSLNTLPLPDRLLKYLSLAS